MKRILAALLLLVLCAGCAAAEDDEGYYILCRPDGLVNVHSRPVKDSPVIGWVAFGRYVRTDGIRKGNYIHVIDLAAEEEDGWVCAGYLVYDRPRGEAYRAEIVSEWNVIARKNIGGKRVNRLRNGQKVTVYARSNEWAVTSKGFIMCDWLKEVDEE